jgi:DivIVA domain-containing protein
VAIVWVLLGIVVLGGVAVVAAGRGEGLPPAEPDRPDLTLSAEHPLLRADVDAVRFSVGLRGYRMDEVDDVLDRLAHEIELREQRIARLEGRAPDEEESPLADFARVPSAENGVHEVSESDEAAESAAEGTVE